MAQDKAKEFVKYLMSNPELQEKMSGFTYAELQAEVKGAQKANPGLTSTIIANCGFVTA